MTRPSSGGLLEQLVALQRDLAIPPGYRMIRRGRVPVVVEVPAWEVHPAVREAELRELERDGFRFPRELVELYTQVGNGFRYAGQEFAPADTLVRAWREARDAEDDDDDDDDDENDEPAAAGDRVTLVPVSGRINTTHDHLKLDGDRCEVWRGSDDDAPVKAFESLEAWLESTLGIWVRQLSERRDQLAPLHAKLSALDFARIRTHAELATSWKVLYETQEVIVREGFHVIAAVRLAKLRELVEHVRLEHLDRELADRISHELFDKHHWALASSFLETCTSLFPATDPASIEALQRLAVSYAKQGRVSEALISFETCVALGKSFHRCNVARSLLDLGRPVDAEPHIRACTLDDTYALDVLGRIELALGRPEQAEAAFKQSIERQRGQFGRYPEPHLSLAALYLRDGRLADAAHVLLPEDYVIGWLGQRSEYFALLAELFDREGDRDSAELARSQARAPHLKTWAS